MIRESGRCSACRSASLTCDYSELNHLSEDSSIPVAQSHRSQVSGLETLHLKGNTFDEALLKANLHINRTPLVDVQNACPLRILRERSSSS